MKLPRFIKWIMFNPKTIIHNLWNLIPNIITLISNIARAKEIGKENFLMKEYESGRILQVNNNKDNKKHLLSLEVS
ncbi:hypothetical protein KAT51_00990 [bacterium]|nr:hypothetical protein [bacterium]